MIFGRGIGTNGIIMTEWEGVFWGIKEAMDRFIEYGDIPDNALLWLRDLTTGQQEWIFTYCDGQIRFW